MPDTGVQDYLDTHLPDRVDFSTYHVSREPIFGYPGHHHSAGLLEGLEDRHRVAFPCQEISRGKACRTGTYNSHLLVKAIHGLRVLVALARHGHFGRKALEILYAERLIKIASLTPGFARIRAYQTANPRKRIVFTYYFDCLVIATLSYQSNIRGDVYPCRAIQLARRGRLLL